MDSNPGSEQSSRRTNQLLNVRLGGVAVYLILVLYWALAPQTLVYFGGFAVLAWIGARLTFRPESVVQ
jgi:hypothetical protein